MNSMRTGLLLAFEGIDGAGKTTIIRGVYEKLCAAGYSTCMTKEPGDTNLGKQIRTLVQQSAGHITAQAEFLLFAADRAEHIQKLVKPALDAGVIILCDRMADSSVAYQGYGRGLDIALIKQINSWVMGEVTPDHTFYLALDYVTAQTRMQGRGAQLSEFDRAHESFFSRVIQGYEQLYAGRSDVTILDGTSGEHELVEQVYSSIMRLWACHE